MLSEISGSLGTLSIYCLLPTADCLLPSSISAVSYTSRGSVGGVRLGLDGDLFGGEVAEKGVKYIYE